MRVIRGGARVVRWVERSDLPLRQDQPPFADAQKKRLRKAAGEGLRKAVGEGDMF